MAREREIDQHIGDFSGLAVYAIPDPHIERWLLLDAAAFKAVFGRGCAAPDQKCERHRYKTLLREAIRDAGIIPLLGGIEYAEDLVKAMNLRHLERADRSLRRLIRALRDRFKAWEQT